MSKLKYIRITGTGLDFRFRAREHEVLALPASTYHKFVLENGTEIFYNDFGVRTVVVSSSETDLN